MIRNYFADLELGIDATLEDVRRAYRKLARKFHPDLNPLDIQAEASFRTIQEAFERLDSVTRIEKFRKQLGAVPKGLMKRPANRWGNYPIVPESPEQFISQWGSDTTARRRLNRPEEKLDFWMGIELTAKEIRDGATKRLQIPFDQPCEKCRGSGGRSRSVKATCKKCAGLGSFLIERGAMHWRKTCDDCLGKGYLVSAPCDQCAGKGKVSSRDIIELKISKNYDFSKALVLKGFGHISFDGKKRGDLWVQIAQRR